MTAAWLRQITSIRLGLRLLLCVLCTPVMAQAELKAGDQVFVSDQLSAPVRSGPGDKARVIGRATTGDPLSVVSLKSGYVQVKNANGQTAWMKAEDLMAQPPAREMLSQLRDQLQAEKTQSAQSLQQCESRLQELRRADESVCQQKQQQVSAAAPESATLPAQQSQPASSTTQPSLLLSLGLVIVGILLGLIIASLRGARL